jgi:hypothetical protein
MMQQPIQDRRGQDLIVEDLAPVREALVAGDNQAPTLGGADQQPEEQAGLPRESGRYPSSSRISRRGYVSCCSIRSSRFSCRARIRRPISVSNVRNSTDEPASTGPRGRPPDRQLHRQVVPAAPRGRPPAGLSVADRCAAPSARNADDAATPSAKRSSNRSSARSSRAAAIDNSCYSGCGRCAGNGR